MSEYLIWSDINKSACDTYFDLVYKSNGAARDLLRIAYCADLYENKFYITTNFAFFKNTLKVPIYIYKNDIRCPLGQTSHIFSNKDVPGVTLNEKFNHFKTQIEQSLKFSNIPLINDNQRNFL